MSSCGKLLYRSFIFNASAVAVASKGDSELSFYGLVLVTNVIPMYKGAGYSWFSPGEHGRCFVQTSLATVKNRGEALLSSL